MDDFNLFLSKLLEKPSTDTIVEINGIAKKIKAFVHLTTVNYLKNNGDYYKILFQDNAFLLVMPGDKEIYYAEILGKIESIPDEIIGKSEEVSYNGKIYRLGNKDDYQLVLELLVGSPLDIEGEVQFSDYFPTTGPKEFLSLGWLMRTGKRVDINCQIINIEQVKIIN